MDLVLLMESKLLGTYVEALARKIGFLNFMFEESVGLSGGFILSLCNEVSIKVGSSSHFHIDSMVSGLGILP